MAQHANMGLDAEVSEVKRVILTVVSEERCPVFRVGDQMILDLPSVQTARSDPVCALALASYFGSTDLGGCPEVSVTEPEGSWFCPRIEKPVEFRVEHSTDQPVSKPISSLRTEDLPGAVAQLRTVSVFRALPAALLGELATNLRIESYAPGSIIIERSLPGSNFYIIAEGEVEVISPAGASKESVIRILKERDIFGEMSLLTNSPAAATIRAKTKVVVQALSGSYFNRLVEQNAFMASRFAKLLAARLLATNYLLAKEGNQAFRGKLTVMNLATVLQVLGEARRSGRLRLRSPEGEEAWVGFKDGQVLDATLGEVRGAEAIYGLLRWLEADFWLESKPVPTIDTVQAGIMGLLLEGMRRIDEG